jgi:hypothetical protein
MGSSRWLLAWALVAPAFAAGSAWVEDPGQIREAITVRKPL